MQKLEERESAQGRPFTHGRDSDRFRVFCGNLLCMLEVNMKAVASRQAPRWGVE